MHKHIRTFIHSIGFTALLGTTTILILHNAFFLKEADRFLEEVTRVEADRYVVEATRYVVEAAPIVRRPVVEVVEVVEAEPELEIKEVSYKRYSTTILNIRQEPHTDSEILGKFSIGDKVEVIGKVVDSDWVQIEYKGEVAFVNSKYLSKKKPETFKSISNNWNGPKLTRRAGRIQGPSGEETYYNLNMSGVVSIMRSMGNNDEYWVRSDGCKMLGDYLMVAADLNIHPRGSIVQTSLGLGRVCDTGTFTYNNPYQIDIAVTW